MSLKGRVAVVTGAGRGIGAETARALARAGASFLLAARTRRELEAVARSIGRQARVLPCDVTKPASVKALAKKAGAVHILVNAAGVAPSDPLLKIRLADWQRTMAVNATGPLLTMQAFLPGMLKARWGRIVNVASTAAKTAGPYIAAYAASKHALLGLTRAAAAECASRGVTVNAVCPGFVDTEMTRTSLKRICDKTGLSRTQALDFLKAQSPQKRLIEPEEVAWLIASLCADEARGLHGQALVLDGGGTMS